MSEVQVLRVLADPPWLSDPSVSLRARAVIALVERFDEGGGLTRDELEILIGGGHAARKSAIADAARSGYLMANRLPPKKANQYSSIIYRLRSDGLRASPPIGRPVKLYRHFDSAHLLLYVGICLSSAAREKVHARNSAWHCFSATRTEEVVIGHPEAIKAEAQAIQHEDPIFNFPGPGADWKFGRIYDYFTSHGREDLWLAYVRGTSAEALEPNSLPTWIAKPLGLLPVGC